MTGPIISHTPCGTSAGQCYAIRCTIYTGEKPLYAIVSRPVADSDAPWTVATSYAHRHQRDAATELRHTVAARRSDWQTLPSAPAPFGAPEPLDLFDNQTDLFGNQ
jgi:hypothetical protein